MKILKVLLFVLSINTLFGQNKPADFGFKAFSFEEDQLGIVNYYVSINKIKKSKPLLLFVEGSSALPIYSIVKRPGNKRSYASAIPFDINRLSNKFHVVIISKPGIPFLDSINSNSSRKLKKKYRKLPEFKKRMSLDWRVNASSLVLTKLPVENNNVYVIGYSEGGQVVPQLALKNSKIKKIVNIVGGGLNQLYDFIIEERLKAEKEK